MARSLDTNIRRNRTSLLAGYLAALAMKLWAMTLRFDVNDTPKITQPYIAAPPVIFALWHNRIFTMPPIWARTGGKFRKTVVLTSASKDGTSLATAMSCFGLGAIRGSSSRRAVSALIGMKKALQSGFDVCVTPDGPRGPRYQVQPGVIKIAQTTGTDIIPIHIRYTAAWRLKTWDQFVIPIPFSRVSVIFDTPQHIPHDLDEKGFEDARLALEKCLIAGSGD